MTFVFNTLQENFLGYTAIFACLGMGFLFLKRIYNSDAGPGYWAVSFFLNSLGFLFWSEVLPLPKGIQYLIGEVFHMSGFWFLAIGVYGFIGKKLKPWNIVALSIWILVWCLSIASYGSHPNIATFALKALRSILFIFTGFVIRNEKSNKETAGRNIAGISLIAWGVYIIIFSIYKINQHLYYGFLVGMTILAAFGMVAMVMDKIQIRAEERKRHIEQLEGILPICSYCKKIRDEKNEWHIMEAYIEDRSKAEFSHGICPDCLEKFQPDKD